MAKGKKGKSAKKTASKAKRKQSCGRCRKSGHNSRRCPTNGGGSSSSDDE